MISDYQTSTPLSRFLSQKDKKPAEVTDDDIDEFERMLKEFIERCPPGDDGTDDDKEKDDDAPFVGSPPDDGPSDDDDLFEASLDDEDDRSFFDADADLQTLLAACRSPHERFLLLLRHAKQVVIDRM